MSYSIYSEHAPTGEAVVRTVSTNPYSSQGRVIGFPSTFDLYVRQISDVDGSQSVVENRKVTDLIGSRLYLHHRPLINSNGTVTTISSSDGVIDTTYTNSRQGYVIFSSLPTSDFTVSYVAVPDCDVSWSINTVQDSVMEIEKILGPTNDSTYPGIRNLKITVFDSPADAVASGVLQNSVYLSDLDRNIVIASSSDPSLKIIRGDSHTIQLGRATDNLIIDATGISIIQSDGTKNSNISLGGKTGDLITWKGSSSGAGQMTLGGPEWPIYSGKVFSTALTGSFYTGAMLRVHGDVAVMGNLKAVGNITIVNTTGTTSTVLGDWTVQDELFVNGISHLNGDTQTNTLEVNQNLYIDKDIVANNAGGSGGYGQCLVDGLDCSEIAWTYNTSIKTKHLNSVIGGMSLTGYLRPKKVTVRPWMELGPNKLVGDLFTITGQLNAAASSSGAHPNILQLLMTEGIISGTYTGPGTSSGTWSPGLMQPGNLWIKMLDGPAASMSAPIYGYTVEQTGSSNINRLNVFLPEAFSVAPQTNNKYVLYNPGAVPYDYVYALGGANPSFYALASTSSPLAISFEDSVRIMTSNSPGYSMLSALENSTSGFLGTTKTGIAYLFADSNGVDPEQAPLFKARATPFRMNGQTPIGEVIATFSGASWTINETISYRPNGKYDSAWIPIYGNASDQNISGRATPGFTSASTSSMKVYFHHYLGGDVDIGNISADLYLGAPSSIVPTWNQTATPLYSFFGQDPRNQHGLSGTFIHVPLGAKRTSSSITERDASIFYLDSALIGVDISPGLVATFPMSTGSTPAPTYLRLLVNKNN